MIRPTSYQSLRMAMLYRETFVRCYMPFLVLVACTNVSAADLYKCTDKNGNMVFSDKPCSGAAERVEMKEIRSIGANADTATDSRMEAALKQADRAAIERKIKERERKIKGLQTQMDSEMKALKQEMSRSANNLAGAQRDTGLAQQMQAVAEKYKAMITSEQAQVDRLNAELSELN